MSGPAVAEDDVIDAYAGIEAALAVEVEDLVDRVGRLWLINVSECATVSERVYRRRQAEEPPNAESIQPLALRH